MVFLDVSSGLLNGSAGGNHAGDGFAGNGMGERIRRPVAGVVFLGASAAGLTALAKAGYQRAGSQVTNFGELGFEFVAFAHEGFDIGG